MKKFDFVIGNPPYQEETEANSASNGQNPRTNIFQYFQMEADKIAKESSVMIYPGGRWIHQFGKGCKDFGKQQINDPTLDRVDFYPDSKEIFGQSADLADGITVVVKKKKREDNGFEYNYIENGSTTSVHVNNPGNDLLPLNPHDLSIVNKVDTYIKTSNLDILNHRILPRTLFGVESDFVAKNPTLVRPFVDDSDVDFEHEVKVLTNDKAGKAGRAKWYVTSIENLRGKERYIHEWQVAVSSANAGGQKRDNQIEIIDNHSAFGRARVALASFQTKEEAEHFYAYCQTYLIRYLFLMTDESLTSLGKRVLDIMDYRTNAILDFTKPLDEQLFQLVQLDEPEINYICGVIDDIDKKRGKGDKQV